MVLIIDGISIAMLNQATPEFKLRE